MPRPRQPLRRAAAPARLLAISLLAAATPARAETLLLADAATNLGYARASDAGDRASTDLRGALTLEFPSPRTTTRAGYSLTASLSAGDAENYSTTYSNELFVSTSTALTPRGTLTLGASVSQGTTLLRLTQRAPESGQPAFRTTENTDLVSGVASESYVFEKSARLRLRQSLSGSFFAPRDAPERSNTSVVSALGLDHRRGRDDFGLELRSAGSSLHRTTATASNEQFWNVRGALVGRWMRELSPTLRSSVAAGVEQSVTFVDSYPLAVVPTAVGSLLYVSPRVAAALDASYGTAVDLVTGTVTTTAGVFGRVGATVGRRRPLQLGASGGFLHAEPLGQSRRVAAGTGNAVQGDAGLVWTISPRFVATLRYTASYQYDQPRPNPPLLTQVVLAGVMMQYTSGGTRPFVPGFVRDAAAEGRPASTGPRP